MKAKVVKCSGTNARPPVVKYDTLPTEIFASNGDQYVSVSIPSTTPYPYYFPQYGASPASFYTMAQVSSAPGLHVPLSSPQLPSVPNPVPAEGFKYTLRSNKDMKRESLDDTEEMFAFSLLGKENKTLLGIDVNIPFDEKKMVSGYGEDDPCMMAVARAVYSTMLHASPDQAANYLPNRCRSVTTYSKFVSVLRTFCQRRDLVLKVKGGNHVCINKG